MYILRFKKNVFGKAHAQVWRYTVMKLVEVQCYNLQGRRFDSRCGHPDFSVT